MISNIGIQESYNLNIIISICSIKMCRDIVVHRKNLDLMQWVCYPHMLCRG